LTDEFVAQENDWLSMNNRQTLMEECYQ
jgi:hypothetical protein